MSGKEWAWMLCNVFDWSTVLIANYFALCIHFATWVLKKGGRLEVYLEWAAQKLLGWRESVFV